MKNEKRLKQIDYSIIGIIIFIFILIHSIYLLICEKKSILGQSSLTDKEFVVNSIINRGIALIVVIMFLFFNISNCNDNNNINQKLKVLVSTFSLLAILIELYCSLDNYIQINKDEEN